MRNHIIIDGWNVCWKIPELAELIPADLESVRIRFNRLVAGYFAGKKVIYRIVYDGQPKTFAGHDRLSEKVIFSQNPEKADDLIIRHLKKQKNKKSWTVVTSDKRLSLQAKDLGAQSVSAEDFIKRLQFKKPGKFENDQKLNPKIDEDEITYWMDQFLNDPDT